MKYVLFVCNHNAGRSQIAQALVERHAPTDLRAESAGSTPADEIWPPVVEAMREVGIDLAGRQPKKLTLEMQLHADWAITLACGAQCPYVASTVEDWDFPDPAGKPIEDVRADRTGHELRLRRLLPDLVKEFEGVHSEGEIRACADAILADYDLVNA